MHLLLTLGKYFWHICSFHSSVLYDVSFSLPVSYVQKPSQEYYCTWFCPANASGMSNSQIKNEQNRTKTDRKRSEIICNYAYSVTVQIVLLNIRLKALDGLVS